jgi:hypothetical protein
MVGMVGGGMLIVVGLLMTIGKNHQFCNTTTASIIDVNTQLLKPTRSIDKVQRDIILVVGRRRE